MLTYSQRKSFNTTGNRAVQTTINDAAAAVKAERDARWAANEAAYKKLNTPIPFTEEQYKAAPACASCALLTYSQ